MSVIISTDDLEHSCPNCKGQKYIIANDQNEPCPKCEGKGVVLTALGQTLLHFIKKHI
ncbi:tryptophan RNA-binding attenuator protein inhibitory protein [Bacillus sp. SA1-12]|uniref:tryptophan RNA-binding attenuator protein inhibitory protein n=1 Tax=Bacillus sp. SA1-12 TaxID=1455638 RepID=UPI00062701EB|nr:tryptophan RNA-binding attenuator protein inhibitory protein [Bacillus sp. SA1-12]KKI90723.1 tryptophan RNA-binding attenuator protein inhibitory protein [Bacillus sp. SA1-12]